MKEKEPKESEDSGGLLDTAIEVLSGLYGFQTEEQLYKLYFVGGAFVFISTGITFALTGRLIRGLFLFSGGIYALVRAIRGGLI